MSDALIFELSKPGRKAYTLPACDVPEKDLAVLLGKDSLREKPADLPEVYEVDVVRHFTGLSQKNYGVDSGFYPLGSCTMKYNPKINEVIARLDGFTNVHPYQDENTVQGCLQLMHDTQNMLCEITGMDEVSLLPAAGAHGELTGLMMIRAYHESSGDTHRRKIIVPDSAHGTNPASAAMVGYDVVEVNTNAHGTVDLGALREAVDENIAGLMLTNPSTLGLFETDIVEIAKLVHENGGLLYYDGANMNAVMGVTSPGDMGFDVVHLNLHKTFSTPHGGGGPGAGPVGVSRRLAPFLPVPKVAEKDGRYTLETNCPDTIGRIKAFYGNFAVVVRACCYILIMGAQGLTEASRAAVLNANYMMQQLKDDYHLPYDRTCMHEFVLGGVRQITQPADAYDDGDAGAKHVRTYDVAKRLLDYGYHPPTVYFPLIVDEALMIEPPETESKQVLDEFIDVMTHIARECRESPELVRTAPHNTPVGRLDEAGAARTPVLNCCVR